MIAHGFPNYELQSALNNPYIPIERMLGVKNALVTIYKNFLEQTHVDVTPLIQSNWTLQEEIRFWHAQESHQTTLKSFFKYA